VSTCLASLLFGSSVKEKRGLQSERINTCVRVFCLRVPTIPPMQIVTRWELMWDLCARVCARGALHASVSVSHVHQKGPEDVFFITSSQISVFVFKRWPTCLCTDNYTACVTDQYSYNAGFSLWWILVKVPFVMTAILQFNCMFLHTRQKGWGKQGAVLLGGNPHLERKCNNPTHFYTSFTRSVSYTLSYDTIGNMHAHYMHSGFSK